MRKYPESLEKLIQELKKLPGIGRVSAERLAFFLLSQPDERALTLSQALVEVKEKIRLCQECFHYAEGERCAICLDPGRDRTVICVVSQPHEVLKFEKTSEFYGLYHVLGGLISPVNDVSPDDLHIDELLGRLRAGETQELILALDPKVEGEATAMYIARQIRKTLDQNVKITQLAHGVPVGRDLEFADEITLGKALRGRVAL